MTGDVKLVDSYSRRKNRCPLINVSNVYHILLTAEGLKQVMVTSYADIEAQMDQGTMNRTVASTNMNATSSRAHTIVGIHFTQKQKNAAGQETAKTSIVNLVDLAGR